MGRPGSGDRGLRSRLDAVPRGQPGHRERIQAFLADFALGHRQGVDDRAAGVAQGLRTFFEACVREEWIRQAHEAEPSGPGPWRWSDETQGLLRLGRWARRTRDLEERLNATLRLRELAQDAFRCARAQGDKYAAGFFLAVKISVSSVYAERMTEEQLQALVRALEIGCEGELSRHRFLQAERELDQVGRGMIPPLPETTEAPA